MPRANATGIGTRQVEFLATTDLGLRKTTIFKILRFKMPTFDQVEEYAKKIPDDERHCFFDDQLRGMYLDYKDCISRIQRRIIRYLNLCLAMKGRISAEENSQIAQDLVEIDVDLSNPTSVKSGWERVGDALRNSIKQFNKYAQQATDLSNYITLRRPLDWMYTYTDEECFGSVQLYFDLWLQFVAALMADHKRKNIYVKPSKRQVEEMKAKRDRIWEETSDTIATMVASSWLEFQKTIKYIS